MLIRRLRTLPMLLAAAVVLCVFLGSCRTAKFTEVQPEAANPIETNIAFVNEAAYPEGSYAVVQGDTPRGIAAKLHIDYRLFANANGISEGTVLTPGYVLVVPKVRPRSDNLISEGGRIAAPPEAPAPKARVVASAPAPAASAPKAAPAQVAQPAPAADSGSSTVAWSGEMVVPVGADGIVKAVASGKVAEVHRGYPTLGDVVIIENQEKRQRAVYAGAFTPTVSAGALVNLGQPIASGARAGGVKVTKFVKLQH